MTDSDKPIMRVEDPSRFAHDSDIRLEREESRITRNTFFALQVIGDANDRPNAVLSQRHYKVKAGTYAGSSALLFQARCNFAVSVRDTF